MKLPDLKKLAAERLKVTDARAIDCYRVDASTLIVGVDPEEYYEGLNDLHDALKLRGLRVQWIGPHGLAVEQVDTLPTTDSIPIGPAELPAGPVPIDYGPVRGLICSCCGGHTTGRQWHNRDTGYGLCPGCVDFCRRGVSDEEFRSSYGLPGVHFDLPADKYSACTHPECGRFYDHNSRRMSCRAIRDGACVAGETTNSEGKP